MNRISQIAAAVVLATPLFAVAQTTGPAAQPRTNLEKQQTEQNGEATKYGEPGSASTSQTNRKDKKASKDGTSTDSTAKTSSKSMKKDTTSTSNDTTSTPTPTNTVSPTTTK